MMSEGIYKILQSFYGFVPDWLPRRPPCRWRAPGEELIIRHPPAQAREPGGGGKSELGGGETTQAPGTGGIREFTF